MITVRLHDGRQVNVQTDDPAKAAKVAHEYAKITPSGAQSSFRGMAGEFLDGALPGLAGAVRGTRETVLNAARAPFSASEDFHPRQSYLEGQADQEAIQKATRAAHPIISGTATGAGMATGLILPAGKIAKGAALSTRMAHGAKVAGVYGGLSGILSSKSHDLKGLATDALQAAEGGAIVGGAFPVAARIAGAVARPFEPLVAPVVKKIGEGIQHLPGRMAATVGDYFARDPHKAQALQHVDQDLRNFVNPATGRNWTPAEVAQDVNRRHEMGVPAAPADIHESARRSFGAAARAPGPATAAVRRALDRRQEKTTERVAAHIADTLGPVTNVEQQADALHRYGQEVSKPLYDVSDRQPIPFVKELQELFQRPSAKEAVQRAGRELLDRGEPLHRFGLVQRPDGVFELGKAPTMPLYDLATQKLNEGIYAGDKPFATDTATSFGKGARDIRKRLLELMDGDGSGPRIPEGTPEAPAGLPGGTQAPEQALPAPEAPTLPNGSPAAPTLPSAAAGLPMAPPTVRSNAPALPASNVPGPNEVHGQWGEVNDPGQRLEPEMPAEPAAPRDPGPGSAIPDNGLNPYWKPAREAYAGPAEAKKALELGEELAGKDATTAGNRMADMTGIQKDFFRLGHRTGLADIVKDVGDYGNAARTVAGSLGKREALEAVHGPAAADLLGKTQAEHEAHQTWSAVRGNSHTIDRAAEIADQDARIQEASGGILQAMAGHPGAGAMTALRALVSGERGQVKGHIAEILGDTDPISIAKNMTDVEREAAIAEQMKRFRAAALLRGSRIVGGALGTNMIEPVDNQ